MENHYLLNDFRGRNMNSQNESKRRNGATREMSRPPEDKEVIF